MQPHDPRSSSSEETSLTIGEKLEKGLAFILKAGYLILFIASLPYIAFPGIMILFDSHNALTTFTALLMLAIPASLFIGFYLIHKKSPGEYLGQSLLYAMVPAATIGLACGIIYICFSVIFKA